MYSRNPCMGLSGAFSVIQEEDRVEWKDGKCRCCWANPKNERYIRYHDEEWGRSVHDDRKLFEMLVLECFQAGLSWECILNKREAFKQAFDEYGSFDCYLWHWTEGKVICETGKTNSALSDRISEDLKKRGMKFVGTTVVYAYLQAVGVVWGHEENCFLSLHQGKNMQKK